MLHRPWFWLAGLGVVLVAVLTPYLLAYRGQPSGYVFSGLLINPVDGFSYLAKMRQGAGGSWLFHLPYTAEPGQGTLLFLYYLGLGHLQRLIGADPLVAYHSARLLGTVAMLGAASVFYRRFLASQAARSWAFALTAIGAGLGWLGLGLGRLAIDLWVPEAIPFLAAFANPHFPLAAACILIALTAIAAPAVRRSRRLLGSGLAGLVLALVQPFAVLTVIGVGGAWLVWMRGRATAESESPKWVDHGSALGLFALAAAPWILYDLWITTSHSALAAWSSQNVTPSPPMIDVFLGFGLVFVLALVGAWVGRAWTTSSGRLLTVWLGLGLVLVFAPIALQRRMLLGVFFPMAGLAALAFEALSGSVRPLRRLTAYALFAVCLPTNLLVAVITLGGALRQQPEVVLTRSEWDSYQWAGDGLPSGALVLAGEVSANRLPAFASVRVIYGHPFETPNAESELEWVNATYRSELPSARVLDRLESRQVDFVYVGARERLLGDLAWLETLDPVYSGGDVTIYQVPPP